MKTKEYNQKLGTLKHYKNENKRLQSKPRNTKTLQEWKQKNIIKNEEYEDITIMTTQHYN